MTVINENLQAIDQQLSNRHIDLDPSGYFIIYIDQAAGLICAKHYTNTIDEQGLAVDPETGKVIPAKGKVDRTATTVFTGRTAKELCIAMFEGEQAGLITMFDHAAYIGREAQRAEAALISNQEYVQD